MNAPLGPGIPVVDVQIGSANARCLHAHQYFAGTGSGNRNFAQFDAGRGLGLYNGLHGGGHKANPPCNCRPNKSINRVKRQVVERCRELKACRKSRFAARRKIDFLAAFVLAAAFCCRDDGARANGGPGVAALCDLA